MCELESILHELHTIGSESISWDHFIWQHRHGMGCNLLGDLTGRMDRHNVLRARRAQLLGLDLFCAIDCGTCVREAVTASIWPIYFSNFFARHRLIQFTEIEIRFFFLRFLLILNGIQLISSESNVLIFSLYLSPFSKNARCLENRLVPFSW